MHNQIKVDEGFFAKLFGRDEAEPDRDREQDRGTGSRRTTTSGNR